MKNRFLTILLVFLMFFTIIPKGVGAAEKKTIRVNTDPRIELMSVVELLAGYWPMCQYDLEYTQEVYNQFGSYWDHPVLRKFVNMWFMFGFSEEIPYALMLHLSDPPELLIKTNIPKYILDRAGGEKNLYEFIDLLRDFAKKSQFKEFYEINQAFYKEHVDKVTELLSDKDYAQILEDFFGPNRYGYAIILSPLVYEKGYSINFSGQIYCIIGPFASIDKKPVFDEPEALSRQVYHVFSQSFIQPLTSQNREIVVTHSKLMNPIYNEMMMQGCKDWQAAFNEHLILSAMTAIFLNEKGEEESEKFLTTNYNLGFIYIDCLYDLMLQYSSNRDIYPTYADFYPHILDAISYLCEQPYAPRNLNILYASDNGVQLSWNDNSSDELGFMVYRRKSKNEAFVPISELLPPNNTPFQVCYRDEDVSEDEWVEYRVAAVGKYGEIFTNRSSIKIPVKAPLAPRDINWKYNAEKKTITIFWKYLFKVDGFKIYSIGEERKLVDTLSSDSYQIDIKIEEIGTYRYVITAFKKVGEKILESIDSPIITINIG